MEKLLVVFCTFPDAASARQIGTLLVEKQHAACVNLLPSVESIYRWQGKVENAAEVLAIFKTSATAFPAFEKALAELHPYEVPEIIAIEPAKVAESYRSWAVAQILTSESRRDAIFPLWCALGTARAFSDDFELPWESKVPSVMRAWSELTAPHNLDALVAWLETPDEMNPVAKKAAIKALEACLGSSINTAPPPDQ